MIGERIKHFRTKNKFTQEELAIVLDVKRKEVIDWEKGLSLPSKENLALLSDFFGVDVNELKVDFTSKNNKIIYVHHNPKRNAASLLLFLLGLFFLVVGIGVIFTTIIIYYTNDLYLYYNLVEALTIDQLSLIANDFIFYSILFICLGIITLIVRFFVIHFKRVHKGD